MQEALCKFVNNLGALSSYTRQRQLSDVNCFIDVVDPERDWVTFAQELYLTQGVGLLQFDRVSGYFSHLCDTADVEWVINKPFDSCEGKTMIHLETMNKQNALLKVLLNMGGMFIARFIALYPNCGYYLLSLTNALINRLYFPSGPSGSVFDF